MHSPASGLLLTSLKLPLCPLSVHNVGVRFGNSYREVLGKTTFPPLQVGVTNRHETYFFSFWDQFKVVGGFGSSRGVDETILNEVRNLLPGDFPVDF